MTDKRDNLIPYQNSDTREIEMPDGSKRMVRMSSLFWDNLEFLQVVEGITTAEIATYALEETASQGVTFNRAFRNVVGYLANRWT